MDILNNTLKAAELQTLNRLIVNYIWINLFKKVNMYGTIIFI